MPRLWLGAAAAEPFAKDPGEIAQSFYYDTILYDGPALQHLADKVGTDRLVVGSDYPFTIKQDKPAQFAERALSIGRAALTANTRRLLGLG